MNHSEHLHLTLEDESAWAKAGGTLETPPESAPASSLGHVPHHQRTRILSGMRWSFWLSGIAVPFGAVINLFLARVGPETIGVYGLLSVYLGLLTSLLYFGGDSVIIKFVPACKPDDQVSFLVSYLAVILFFLLPFLGLGYFSPGLIGFVLGRDLDPRDGLLLLCLAPVPIIFQMVLAGLKGTLDIKAAQILSKSLNILSVLAYGIVIVAARPILIYHPRAIIWGIYLVLSTLITIVGGLRIYRSCRGARVRPYLPNGFWRYAIDTQALSVATFLSGRLDYIFLLNFGGLADLGCYVAVTTIATTVSLVGILFMDTLLPSLTNMIAAQNERAAAQVFTMHMRILFLVTVAMACGIMVLAVDVAWIMGPQYAAVVRLIIAATLFQGISVPGTYGGTLLSSVGRQRSGVITSAIKAAGFCAMFLVTWSRWHLAAAVCANGLAGILCNVTLMTVGRRAAPFYPSVADLWTKAIIVEATVAAIALAWMPLSWAAGVAVWIAAMAALLWAGHYDLAELRSLMQVFVSSKRISPAFPATLPGAS